MKGRVSVIFRRGIAIAGWRPGDMLYPRGGLLRSSGGGDSGVDGESQDE
jgi:hypothetical protein